MYYFLTHTINDKLAGLEIAMINRLKVFKNLKVPAKILTFHYNRFLHENLKKWNILDADVINLFDYLQETVCLPNNYKKRNYLSLFLEKVVISNIEKNGNKIVVYDANNRKSLKIETFAWNENEISTIEYLDTFQNIIRKDFFDSRGFLSLTSFYGQDGGTSEDNMYNLNGDVVFRSYYHENKKGEIENSLLTILSLTDPEIVFPDLNSLTAYFYDKVSDNFTSKPIFIADRSYLVDSPLFIMKNKVKKFEFWHNTFTVDYSRTGELVEVMQKEIQSKTINGYILPTKTAAIELAKRIPQNIKTYSAPVALNEVNEVKSSGILRDKNKIILVARIEKQKNIPDALKAFKIMSDERPNLKLYIYGYILDLKLYEELNELITTLELEHSVIFNDYTTNKDEIYGNANLLILTSRNEGWGMVINEAMAYGVPAISYDVDFGPSEIIRSSEDGYIVTKDDYHSLANSAIHLLDDDELRQQFSLAAKENIQRFNLENVSNEWKSLITLLEEG